MKKNTFIHRLYTLCSTVLIALLFSAGCSGLSSDILRGGTDSETGGTPKAGETVSVSFDCTNFARMVLPSPALTDYTYTVTGTVSGGSAETLLKGKTYAEVTASGAVSVDPGNWMFTVAAYSGSSEVLAGSVTADLSSGSQTLPVTLYAVTGGTGSVSVTLNYPAGKGVTKVTAALYDSPVAGDNGSEQTITGGTDTDSVMFRAENVPSATAKFVRFFLYDAQGACLGSYTDSVYVVAGLASTATETLPGVNMFGVTVNILEDGSAWNDSGKIITLKNDTFTYTLTAAVGANAATGSIPSGTYEVYADGVDTGGTLTAKIDGSAQTNVCYYSVTLPTVTGCTITAQSGSESPVLMGGSYSFTITLSKGYTESTVSVTADTGTLTAADDVYTINGITTAQNVTVSGVKDDVYTIIYHLNGGSWTSGFVYLESFCINDNVKLPRASGITRSGYAFDGWYTDKNCTNGIVEWCAETTTGNVELWAGWTGCVTGLTAATGGAQILLTWTNPDDSDFSKAVVTWTTTADTGTQVGMKDVSGTAGSTDSCMVTGLTNDASYTFTVKAVDTAGNESGAETVTATAKKAVIGQIYYTNGTVSSSYNDSSLTPAGIVCAVYDDGRVKTIVALTGGSGVWAIVGKQGYVTKLATSMTDGKTNTEQVENLSDYSDSYYPAFAYCKNYSVDGLAAEWYLPACDELSAIYNNMAKINTGLNTLSSGGVTATQLTTDYYWSSTEATSSKYGAWSVHFYSGGSENEIIKSFKANVRCVAGF